MKEKNRGDTRRVSTEKKRQRRIVARNQARGPGLKLEDMLTVILRSTAMPNLSFGRVSMRTTSARYSEVIGIVRGGVGKGDKNTHAFVIVRAAGNKVDA